MGNTSSPPDDRTQRIAPRLTAALNSTPCLCQWPMSPQRYAPVSLPKADGKAKNNATQCEGKCQPVGNLSLANVCSSPAD